MRDYEPLDSSGVAKVGTKELDQDVDEYLYVMQQIGVKLLSSLHDACSSLGIDYFVYSGTLLGAKRHQGWIPWDDDVDVAMFREDLEVFRRHAPDLLPPEVRYSDFLTDPRHATKFSRLLYLPSERAAPSASMPSDAPDIRHVALDIFVLDGAPRRVLIHRMWQRAIRVALHLAQIQTSPIKPRERERYKLIRRFYRWDMKMLSRLLPARRWRLLHRKVCMLFSGVGRSRVYAGTNHHKRSFGMLRLERSDLVPAVDGKFGELTVRCPAETDKILGMMYGDSYMTPPPDSQQRPSHRRRWLRATVDGAEYVVDSSGQ